jgi:hypothetical protein
MRSGRYGLARARQDDLQAVWPDHEPPASTSRRAPDARFGVVEKRCRVRTHHGGAAHCEYGYRGARSAQQLVTSNPRDPYVRLSVADLLLVARARSIDIPAGADRDAIVAALQSHDVEASTTRAWNSTVTASNPASPASMSERSGWWTSLSVAALRSLARDHGLDVPAGMHRRELVALLVEHDVRKPPWSPTGRTRRSR